MSQLLSNLQDIKSKLNLLESQVFVENIKKNKEENTKYKSNLNSKISFIQNSQDQIIELDVRGEIMYICKDSIIDSCFDNIILDEIKLGTFISPIFLDFDRSVVTEILNILRYFNTNVQKKDISLMLPYKYYLDKKDSLSLVEFELVNFFKSKDILQKVELITS